MRVSDVVQHADLSVWAEAALVMFLGAFVLVSVRVLRLGRSESRSMAMTPLDAEDLGEKGGGS